MTWTTAWRKIAGGLVFLSALGLAGPASPQFYPTHLDKTKLPLGCQTCHAGGHGTKKSALLRTSDAEVCLSCHDVKAKERNLNIRPKMDLRAVLNKTSHHPIAETAGLHRKGETIPGKYALAKRHVACGDCHDVHWSTPGKALQRVDGINSFGVRLAEAKTEHEICYKCHADSTNLPQKARNKRLEFNQNNPSFHPVESAGKSIRVPSLIPPLTTSSIVKCSDCHGNDDPLGPKGPHGSIYAPILGSNYETRDGLQENSFQYALCYRCHDRNSLLRNQSFPLHNLHVLKVRASCYTCHTAHGSQINTHLISFNPDVVGLPQQQAAPISPPQTAAPRPGLPLKQQTPAPQRLPFSALPQLGQIPSGTTIDLGRYVDLGNGHGQCFLNCHGKDHNPAEY